MRKSHPNSKDLSIEEERVWVWNVEVKQNLVENNRRCDDAERIVCPEERTAFLQKCNKFKFRKKKGNKIDDHIDCDESELHRIA